MAEKPLFEWIKCITRKYTLLSLIVLSIGINALFYLIEHILLSKWIATSLRYHQIILFVVTTIMMGLVGGLFLFNLNTIRDEMVRNLQRLISVIRSQTTQDLSKKIEIAEVWCDDEVFEIVNVLNQKSEQILQYVNHLKYVIGYIQHEFNTPLTTLALSVEQLQRQHSMIETKSLEEEIHHLSKIVNSLSYLCSQHEKEVTLHSVALVSIIKKVEAVLTATYPLAKINFTQDKTNTVQSNEIYLHIIIKNIVENGLKYSGENKTVDITRDNKEQTLSIQDYGQWMSQEEIKNMGLPFWQSDKSRWKNTWVGLWLTLVYELVEILDMSIQVTSEKDKGTHFILQFPQQHA